MNVNADDPIVSEHNYRDFYEMLKSMNYKSMCWYCGYSIWRYRGYYSLYRYVLGIQCYVGTFHLPVDVWDYLRSVRRLSGMTESR
jgi:hypothetical protein